MRRGFTARGGQTYNFADATEPRRGDRAAGEKERGTCLAKWRSTIIGRGGAIFSVDFLRLLRCTAAVGAERH